MSPRPAALVLLSACGAPPSPGTPASMAPVASAELASREQVGRGLKRMDIDQLDAAIRHATGLAWTEVVDGRTVALFEKLSGSLGKPDYLSSTEEDLSPGLLFQKFLDDAAGATCTAMLERERTALPGDRLFLVYADLDDTPRIATGAVDANLAHVVLRFHGRSHVPGSEALAPWRWLFDAAWADTGDTLAAWRTVCVGLITHPAFQSY